MTFNLVLKRMNTHTILWRLSLQATRSTTRRAAAAATCARRFSTDAPKRRRRKKKYEQFSDAKLAQGLIPTTTSLDSPFEYNSGESIEDYKKKAELSPWTPVPDSVARKIFDRAIPEGDDSDQSKQDEVSLFISNCRNKLHDDDFRVISNHHFVCFFFVSLFLS